MPGGVGLVILTVGLVTGLISGLSPGVRLTSEAGRVVRLVIGETERVVRPGLSLGLRLRPEVGRVVRLLTGLSVGVVAGLASGLG